MVFLFAYSIHHHGQYIVDIITV